MRICILGSGMWLHLSRVATRGQACGYTSCVLGCTSLNSSLIVSHCLFIVYMFSVWTCLFPHKHVSFLRTCFALLFFIVHCAFSIVHLLLCIFFCFLIGQVLPPVHCWPGRILESLQSTDSLHSLLLFNLPVPSAASALLARPDIKEPAEHWQPAALYLSFSCTVRH